MKRTVLAAALALCAITASIASAQGSPPTKQDGKVIVGFDLPAPGFWNGRASGTTIKNGTGFEYSLGREIAKAMGIFEGRVPACAVRHDPRRRFQEVRLRARGDDDHGRAGEGHRLLGAVLQRESGRDDRQGRCEAQEPR